MILGRLDSCQGGRHGCGSIRSRARLLLYRLVIRWLLPSVVLLVPCLGGWRRLLLGRRLGLGILIIWCHWRSYILMLRRLRRATLLAVCLLLAVDWLLLTSLGLRL